MATYKGDLMYPAEKYLDRTTNEEKTSWLKCGGVFQGEDGKLSVKITAMPVLMEAGNWFRVFEPKQREGWSQPEPAAATATPDTGFDDDDIPF